MRELKFRAYDNINKEWLLGYKECSGFSMIGELMLMGEWQAILSKMLKGEFGEDGKELLVQQYTGLKDANGVEIYEGDILKHDIGLGPIYYKVFWSDTNGAWMIDKNHGGDCGCWFDNYEIAGNIFENAELLKR
jgi:uncharacterized phage protein (TIGR01671 family)